jgi:hypothetical protein
LWCLTNETDTNTVQTKAQQQLEEIEGLQIIPFDVSKETVYDTAF